MATTSEVSPDHGLVERARNGDAQAFAVLYDRHVDRVYRHIHYRVGNVVDSEDLTQQTFMKAWQAMGRFQMTEAPFLAWLLTIAHHSVISYYRSRRDHKPLDDDLQRAGDRRDPQWSAEQHDRARAVRTALRRLKPDQQQVVTLRFLEELEYSEIASILGKTENNVRVILHRGLQQMRGLLGDL